MVATICGKRHDVVVDLGDSSIADAMLTAGEAIATTPMQSNISAKKAADSR